LPGLTDLLGDPAASSLLGQVEGVTGKLGKGLVQPLVSPLAGVVHSVVGALPHPSPSPAPSPPHLP
ncbi:MAG: hypothetical protein ACREQ5_39010, partial [Candidatus Dormibacteria bacterium]